MTETKGCGEPSPVVVGTVIGGQMEEVSPRQSEMHSKKKTCVQPFWRWFIIFVVLFNGGVGLTVILMMVLPRGYLRGSGLVACTCQAPDVDGRAEFTCTDGSGGACAGGNVCYAKGSFPKDFTPAGCALHVVCSCNGVNGNNYTCTDGSSASCKGGDVCYNAGSFMKGDVASACAAPVRCVCNTPGTGTVNENVYHCTDGSHGTCAKDQACWGTGTFPLGTALVPGACAVPATCSCITPRAGTSNGFACTDGTTTWCKTGEVCSATGSFTNLTKDLRTACSAYLRVNGYHGNAPCRPLRSPSTRLNPGECITSDGAVNYLIDEGALMQYKCGSSLCQRNVPAQRKCVLDAKGTLVCYQGEPAVAWWSSTLKDGATFVPPFVLVMQDDENLVIYDSAGSSVWASGTYTNLRYRNEVGTAFAQLHQGTLAVVKMQTTVKELALAPLVEDCKKCSSADATLVTCSCTTPGDGLSGLNGFVCSDGSSAWCNSNQMCNSSNFNKLDASACASVPSSVSFQPVTVTCACLNDTVSPGYVCSDGTTTSCPSGTHCSSVLSNFTKSPAACDVFVTWAKNSSCRLVDTPRSTLQVNDCLISNAAVNFLVEENFTATVQYGCGSQVCDSNVTTRRKCVLRSSGAFVCSQEPAADWWWTPSASFADAHPPYMMILQADENLVIYNAVGTPVWTANTVGDGHRDGDFNDLLPPFLQLSDKLVLADFQGAWWTLKSIVQDCQKCPPLS